MALVLAVLAGGCKTIPADSYGISRLRFHGVDELDDAALRACLATREREAFQIDLGTSSELSCGEPPFDGGRVPIRIVTWPWTEWPTYDEAVFERDLDRIERWYRARGYYDARVERAEFDPTSARTSDELPPVGEAPCERRRDGQGCALEIDVHVHEGEPVLVRELEVRGGDQLSRRVRARIDEAVRLRANERFDEALHDRTKAEMITAMREGGFACADVRGEVSLDPTQRLADVSYTLLPGESSRFRDVRVEVTGEARGIPLDVVREIAGIERGDDYAPSRLSLAQRDIYAIGSFAAVEVEAVPVRETGSGSGESTLCGSEVDVIVRVTPGRRIRFGVGTGIDSGNVTYSAATIAQASVPQWNVHLLARFEDRNFFGGLRRLRIEERPKVTFQGVFPSPRDPAPGNEVSVEFRQPAFLESATLLTISGRHDYGLDGNYRDTVRHLFDMGAAVSRPFVRGHLSALVGIYGNAFLATRSTTENLPDYAISFFREYLSVDYRDNPHMTRRGALFTIDMQQAGLAKFASWTYFRFQPEIRGFIPLPARLTIAARFGIGATLFTSNANQANVNSASSQVLGPTAYRLRGGGPSSHRGFIAGQLGDLDDCAFLPAADPGACVDPTSGSYDPNSSDILFRPIDGGLRKWEASIELRSQITDSFGAVFFADMGDVDRGRWVGTPSPTDPTRVVYSATRAPRFRFDHPHLALGVGLRYYTIVGPLRLDFAFRIPGAQTIGGDVDATRPHSLFGGGRVQGAVSLTIGEAF